MIKPEDFKSNMPYLYDDNYISAIISFNYDSGDITVLKNISLCEPFVRQTYPIVIDFNALLNCLFELTPLDKVKYL